MSKVGTRNLWMYCLIDTLIILDQKITLIMYKKFFEWMKMVTSGFGMILKHTPVEELRRRTWGFCQRMIDEVRSISSNPEGFLVSDTNRVKFLKIEIMRIMAKKEPLSAGAIACCEEN